MPTERETHPNSSHVSFPYFFSGIDGVDGDGRGICFGDLVIEVVPYGAPIWINDLAIFYGAGLATDYIDTKCSRWDVQDYSVIVSTWLKKDDVNTLLDNIRPGAVKEIMKILGKPTFRDISWQGLNTIRLYPTPSSQKMNSSTLHRMRRNTIIYPKNITMHPINNSDWIETKIEGYSSSNSL